MSALAEIIPFEFESHATRVVILDGKPHWVASDLATLLGYAHVPNMVRMLDDDQKGVHIVSTLGGEQNLTIVTESGMWSCVMKSRRPEAKRFVRWLTDVVLPTLRTTGRFEMASSAIDLPKAIAIPELGTKDDRDTLRVATLLVRQYESLWGQQAGRDMAMKLGFPMPDVDLAPAPVGPGARKVQVEGDLHAWFSHAGIKQTRRDATSVRDLFDHYSKWCSTSDLRIMSVSRFRQAVVQLFGTEEHPEMVRVVITRRDRQAA